MSSKGEYPKYSWGCVCQNHLLRLSVGAAAPNMLETHVIWWVQEVMWNVWQWILPSAKLKYTLYFLLVSFFPLLVNQIASNRVKNETKSKDSTQYFSWKLQLFYGFSKNVNSGDHFAVYTNTKSLCETLN